MIDVDSSVATPLPPQSWEVLPLHLVEQVDAATEGLVLPHRQVSGMSGVIRGLNMLTS